jgi:hypothetical protein
MRFMLLRKADAKTEANVMPSQALLAAMGNYIEAMTNAGVLLAADGLQASSKGTRVKFSQGKSTIIDGPFPNAGELLAGFCIIDVPSREQAIEWVTRWPALDGDGEVEIEIRQLFEAADFGEEFTPELREREEQLRSQTAAKH